MPDQTPDPQPPHPIAAEPSHGMRPRDWFDVGARLLGVWSLISMVAELRSIALFQMDYFGPTTTSRTPLMVYVLHAACDAAVGFYLLFAAGHLTNIVYGHDAARGFHAESAPVEDRAASS